MKCSPGMEFDGNGIPILLRGHFTKFQYYCVGKIIQLSSNSHDKYSYIYH